MHVFQPMCVSNIVQLLCSIFFYVCRRILLYCFLCFYCVFPYAWVEVPEADLTVCWFLLLQGLGNTSSCPICRSSILNASASMINAIYIQRQTARHITYRPYLARFSISTRFNLTTEFRQNESFF